MSNFELTINGKVCKASPGDTILTAARKNGIEIPTLCYHPLVKVYGACGVCLVEVEGSKKLMRACATEAREGMVVNVHGERAENGRRLALELLFSDHRGDCRPPCAEACPAGTDCQGYVGLIANGEYKRAVALIKEKFPLPASIGRVCPHPCETACRRRLVEEPVSIAALKRFVADMDMSSGDTFEDTRAPRTGLRVAIVGGGPSGLTAAYYLAKYGHSPVIFEAMPCAGGMLRYGIPQYRLPKDIVRKEVELIEKMGVEIRYNTKIGRDISFEELEKDYDAVYVAVGAWKSSSIRCKGEEHEGVFGGIDFLRAAVDNKPTGMGRRVAVVGGGNTAMDACRTAIRLGAEKVYIIYRRTQAEMPADELEIEEAMEEGVDFRFLVSPLEITAGADGRVNGMLLQKMQLGEPDASGRRTPLPIEGETELLDVDTVIAAAGQQVVPDGIPVALTKKGTIQADEYTFLTDRKGVFAGGDAINKGPGIAIAAIGHARKAADVIDSYLKGDIIPYCKPYIVTRDDMTEEDFRDRKHQCREKAEVLSPEARRHNFREVSLGLTEEQARREASRCLECGCADYFECKLIKYGREAGVDPARLGGCKRCRETKDEHPFIERNADKCVLCSLCVRVCEEVVGAGVLGLVNRGFDTIVKPEFGTPLKATACLSCGQCVNLCPTGALTEKWIGAKRVPVEEERTKSVCGMCSLGCETVVTTAGKTVCRALPAEGGLLCRGGRFAFGAQLLDRVKTPLLRGESCDMDRAVAFFRERMDDIIARFGANSVGVAISDKLTSEEIALARKLSKEYLKTDVVACLNRKSSATQAVFGRCGSTATMLDLEKADLIIYVGGDLMKTHGVLGMKLRDMKAKLYALTDEDTLLADRIDVMLKEKALPGIAAAVAERSECSIVGSDAFRKALPFDGCEFAAKVADEYLAAKHPVIVYDKQTVSYETALMLCDMARLSGKDRVLELLPRCNSLGLAKQGVGDRTKLLSKLDGLKALVLIGEDAPELDFSKLELLTVIDTHMSETARKADLVLPLASYLESTGTYITSDGATVQLRAAVEPVSGVSNSDLLAMLGGFDEGITLVEHFDTAAGAIVPVDGKAPIFEAPIGTDFGARQFRSYGL